MFGLSHPATKLLAGGIIDGSSIRLGICVDDVLSGESGLSFYEYSCEDNYLESTNIFIETRFPSSSVCFAPGNVEIVMLAGEALQIWSSDGKLLGYYCPVDHSVDKIWSIVNATWSENHRDSIVACHSSGSLVLHHVDRLPGYYNLYQKSVNQQTWISKFMNKLVGSSTTSSLTPVNRYSEGSNEVVIEHSGFFTDAVFLDKSATIVACSDSKSVELIDIRKPANQVVSRARTRYPVSKSKILWDSTCPEVILVCCWFDRIDLA